MFAEKAPRVRLEPMIHGGGHERGMRSGTLPVPLIVGFGKACELCEQEMATEAARLIKLRDRLQEGITGAMEEVYLNGHPTERLPGNLNLSFAYVEGEALLMGVKEIALSSGSACTSATLEPSYVLRALGVGSDLAHSSISFLDWVDLRQRRKSNIRLIECSKRSITCGKCHLSMKWPKRVLT